MRFEKDSIEYQSALTELHQFEELVPMTVKERSCLRRWVYSGHFLDENPWLYCDEYGYTLNYLEAFRFEFGYNTGPWDDWHGEGPYMTMDEYFAEYLEDSKDYEFQPIFEDEF